MNFQNSKIKKVLSLVALGLPFVVFSANQGCDVMFDESGSSSSYDSQQDSNIQDDTENNLLISGSGEVLNVEYNHLEFPAKINWDSGLYFFAPDPEGKITGDKIICAASINESEVEGDCFRSGHVCHFDYWHESWTQVDGKDVYYLGTTSCKKGGNVGPFLVPLDSPICGQDPFPACPSDDLFPTGPVEEGDDVKDPNPNGTETPKTPEEQNDDPKDPNQEDGNGTPQ